MIRLRRRSTVPERIVRFSAHPEFVQQYGELSCNRDYRPILRSSASSFEQAQAIPPQVGVLTELAEHKLSALDQEPSQVPVSGFGDREIRISIARGIHSGGQTNPTPDVTASSEACRVSECQHKCERGQRSNPVDFLQP